MKNQKFCWRKALWLIVGVAVTGSLFLPSCQSEMRYMEDENSPPENPYAISKERALASLQAFMASDGLPGTKSSDTRMVSNVLEMRIDGIRTKLFEGDLIPEVPDDVENLFYVANFEGEQGYAILAADERIGEEILAVTESGSISQDFLQYVLMGLLSDERPVFPDYPLTGPGFFSDPDDPDMLHVNPNTVDLYISAEEDTLVGNFAYTFDGLPEPIYIPSTQGNSHYNQPPTPYPEDLGFLLCVDYALMQIGDTTVIVPPGTVYPVTTSEEWHVTSMVQPMLTQFVDWSQSHGPFNTYFSNSLAGCFNLAIAKVMTYYEFPTNYVANDVAVDWQALKTCFYEGIGATHAANLLWEIGSSTHSWRLCDGTFTFPKKAINYMNSIGFGNVGKYRFSIERVMGMLDRGQPLIIFGMPNINILGSHAWNIDGYKVKDKYEVCHYSNGEITSQYIKTYNMVHCDFGWRRHGNGYYVDKIFFNDENSEYELDDPAFNDMTINFNNYIRLVMYDYPY